MSASPFVLSRVPPTVACYCPLLHRLSLDIARCHCQSRVCDAPLECSISRRNQRRPHHPAALPMPLSLPLCQMPLSCATCARPTQACCGCTQDQSISTLHHLASFFIGLVGVSFTSFPYHRHARFELPGDRPLHHLPTPTKATESCVQASSSSL
jgi:hypothetical protein